MLIKLIKVRTTKDRRSGFLERQAKWNEAMAAAPGFVDVTIGSNAKDECELCIVISWQDRESLEKFMTNTHDNVEAATGIIDFYDAIEVTLLDVL